MVFRPRNEHNIYSKKSSKLLICGVATKENIQENLSENSRLLRRFIISAFHPQNMMRAWSKSYAADQDRLLKVGYRLASIDFTEQFCESQIWREQVKFLPYPQFSINKAMRIESIKSLQKLHSQRLEDEDAPTKVEAGKRLRNLTSALKKGIGERTEAVRSNKSTKYIRSGPMPSSPTKVILGARPSHCTFSHLLEDEKGINDLPLEVECIYIVCLGNSKYGENSYTIVIDQHPRWTKTTPPKYCREASKVQQLWSIQAVHSSQCRFGIIASYDD